MVWLGEKIIIVRRIIDIISIILSILLISPFTIRLSFISLIYSINRYNKIKIILIYDMKVSIWIKPKILKK